MSSEEIDTVLQKYMISNTYSTFHHYHWFNVCFAHLHRI
jgi:hypothetical protein